MASVVPNGVKQYVLDGTVIFGTHSFKAALFADTFTPNKDTHDNWGDVSASEITGTNYPAGGIDVENLTIGHNDTTDKGYVDADDLIYENVTLNAAKWLCVYKDAVADADKKIVGFYDLGDPAYPIAVDFRINFAAAGALTVSQV